jgi:hypothetical protein
MVEDVVAAFSGWLWDQKPDTYDNLDATLQEWVYDYSSPSCGIYVTGGDYTLFLQVALVMFAKAAHGDEDFAGVFPIQALVGGHPKAYLLPRDSILLDERWFQRALIGYISLQRDGVKQPA